MSHTKITVGIVDDHTLFRTGLSGILEDLGVLTVAFEAGNGVSMQEQLKVHPHTQVVLMDIHMPLMDGYTATAWVGRQYPDVRVLALSMFEDDDAVIGMLRAGARGYVLKESKPHELLEAILAVVSKGIHLNEMVSGKMYRSLTASAARPDLNERELEFLRFCCTELTYKEMADQMNISPRTIDNYREALFVKLESRSRTGLVLYAIKHKIFQF